MTTDTEGSRELTVAKRVAGALHKMEPEYRAVLPAHIRPEAFIRVAQTAIQMNEDLQACTPKSLMAACTKLAEIGLQPDGEAAAIVAYNVKVSKRGQPDRWEKQAKPMPMVAGIRDLVRRSGQVKDWKVRIVRKGDFFEHLDGDVESLVHRSAYDDEAPITHVYSIAYLESGEISRHVMTISAVERIRMRSRSPDRGPWATDYPEMVKKTCLRQHSKSLPKAKDDLARERIMGAVRALDDAEDVLQLDRPAPAPMPQLTMHESARRRLQEAVETSAFDVEAEEVTTAPIAAPAEPDDRQASNAQVAEAPKATRKRRSPSERLAAINEPAKGNGQAAPAAAKQQTDAPSSSTPAHSGRSGSPAAPATSSSRAQRQAENEPVEYESQSSGFVDEYVAGENGQAIEDDRFPGDPEPDHSQDDRDGEDPEELAYRDGWHARSGGKTRFPPRTMTTAAEAKAWLDGWDAFDKSVKLGNAPKTAEASEAMLDQIVGRVFV